jgi:serine/threonine protein kinase
MDSGIYKKGDIIGQRYEVHDVLGEGGFGIVYLVYSRETGKVFALKTFRDQYLVDIKTRERFRKEAQVWVDLERHPYLVRAYFIDEISGRLYIAMEHIAPDEHGVNTLEGYLQKRPLDVAQSLRWAIQFCHGMEYAYSKGIKAHRDIKPANILICQDKTINISDFGLASVIGESRAVSGLKVDIQKGKVGFSYQTMEGVGFGTPTHMPPEQFINAAGCDERSDIYSFVVVLYQMATGGRLPFYASVPENDAYEESRRFWIEMYKLHMQVSVPTLESQFFPAIQKCLEKEPRKRYQAFKELRADLEPILKQQTGEIIELSGEKDLGVWEWNNKGMSFYHVNAFSKAVECLDKALSINPQLKETWLNKGNVQLKNHRYTEALDCYLKALEIYPEYGLAWNSAGICLASLGHYEKALGCYNRALRSNNGYEAAWVNKGNCLLGAGEYEEAIKCYQTAIEIDSSSVEAWYGSGNCFKEMKEYSEALMCYDAAIKIDPLHYYAWYNTGLIFYEIGDFAKAISCNNRIITFSPETAIAWYAKALAEDKSGLIRNTIYSYKRFIELASTQYAEQIAYAQQRLNKLGYR